MTGPSWHATSTRSIWIVTYAKRTIFDKACISRRFTTLGLIDMRAVTKAFAMLSALSVLICCGGGGD